MTDRQLLAIHEKKFGQRLSWHAFYDLKAKFVTRPGAGGAARPARLRELLVLEKAGTFGEASVYRLSGLRGAFG
jgi:hypothetical protein